MNTYTITVGDRTLTVNINDTQVIDLVGAAPPCAMAMDDNVVLVTEAFEQLTEQTRNAILTHEVAHMVLHLDVVKSTDQVVNDPNIEAEADAICDGENVYIIGIMEHIERAGVHSGDATIIYPSQRLYSKTIITIEENTKKIV